MALGSSDPRAQRGPPAPRGAPSAAPGPPRPALTIRGSCWTCPWGPRPEGRRARCEGAVRRHLPPPRQALRGALVRGSRDRSALGSARPPAPAPRPPRCASAQNGRRSPTRKRGGRSPSSAYMAGGRPKGATGNRVRATASSRPRPLLQTRSPGGRGGGSGACAKAGLSSLGPVGSERRPAPLIGREAPVGGDVSGQTWQLGRVSARAGRGRALGRRGGAGPRPGSIAGSIAGCSMAGSIATPIPSPVPSSVSASSPRSIPVRPGQPLFLPMVPFAPRPAGLKASRGPAPRAVALSVPQHGPCPALRRAQRGSPGGRGQSAGQGSGNAARPAAAGRRRGKGDPAFSRSPPRRWQSDGRFALNMGSASGAAQGIFSSSKARVLHVH